MRQQYSAYVIVVVYGKNTDQDRTAATRQKSVIGLVLCWTREIQCELFTMVKVVTLHGIFLSLVCVTVYIRCLGLYIFSPTHAQPLFCKVCNSFGKK